MKNNSFNDMSFERFLRNLPLIDWYYNMSDDPRTYASGRKGYEDYRELAATNGTKWVTAFANESKKHTIS